MVISLFFHLKHKFIESKKSGFLSREFQSTHHSFLKLKLVSLLVSLLSFLLSLFDIQQLRWTKPDHTTHLYKTLQSLQIYNKNLDFCHGPQEPTQSGSLILVTSLILFFSSCFFTHYNQSNWALPFDQVLFRLMILVFTYA